MLAHEQLDALAGLVAQRGQRRAGELGEREAVGGRPAEADEAEAEPEATVGVAPHEAVLLEGDGQPVGRGPGQAGRRLQLGQPGRADALEGAQHGDGLVDDPDVRYSVHWSGTLSQNVRR